MIERPYLVPFTLPDRSQWLVRDEANAIAQAAQGEVLELVETLPADETAMRWAMGGSRQ